MANSTALTDAQLDSVLQTVGARLGDVSRLIVEYNTTVTVLGDEIDAPEFLKGACTDWGVSLMS